MGKENKFELGDELECKVTGFRGIATTRVDFLNGCTQYGLQPKVDKDGKKQDSVHIDQEQLKVVKAKKVDVKKKKTGGPEMGQFSL